MENESHRIEKQEILQLLGVGMDSLARALAGIGEPMARQRPLPDSWSVAECVEHMALSEAGLLSLLREASPCPESHQDLAREAKFQNLALNRARSIEAPPFVIPTGQKTLAQAVSDFHAVRCHTVRFVQDFPGDLRWWLTTHPLIKRPVNCYEMLLLMALHPRRHALQIEQISQMLQSESRG